MVAFSIWIVVFACLFILIDILRYIRYFVWQMHNEMNKDDKTLREFVKFIRKK